MENAILLFLAEQCVHLLSSDLAARCCAPVVYEGEDFDGVWEGTYEDLQLEGVTVAVWHRRW